MFKTSIIYKTGIVQNQDPHPLAKKEYYLVYVDADGVKTPALFTELDIAKGILRAEKNKEDAPEYSVNLWQRFLKLFGL